jgi:hypothetical protein
VSHVAPTRWADLARGRLSDADRRRALAHAERCAECARARDRIAGAAAAMADIAKAPAPELGWDHIRARVHWTVSSERRSQQRRAARPRRWWLAAPVLAAAAALVVGSQLVPAARPLPVASIPAQPAEVTPVALAVAPAPLAGVVTLVSGEVAIDGVTAPRALLAHPIAAGSVVRTAVGRVGVQFGAGSAFAVGAGSTVDVRRFDSAAVELAVEGELLVEVSKRAPGQRFTVLAGGRTVEVRGTAFRVVQRDGALEVACSHGRVAVIDRARAGGEIEVGAGEVARIDGDRVLGAAARPLDAAALDALTRAQAPRLPVWADPAQLERTSGLLEIAVAPGRAVRVDGVDVGKGPLSLRVTSGRYLVQAERAPGRWSDAEWLEVGAADSAHLEVVAARAEGGGARPDAPTTPAARDERHGQLERLLDRGRVVTCLRALTKQGITDTFVELDLGIDGDGAVSFLNIADTDLPRSTAACVRDAVSAIQFPAGPAATWRHRLTF